MSSDLIALSLSHPAPGQASTLALVDRLLALLAAHAPDDAGLGGEAFRRRIDEWRSALHADRAATDAIPVDDIADACEAFLDRLTRYRAEREVELFALVQVLRDIVEALRGDSQVFEHELLRSTAAMGRLLELEDLREIKRSLTREVDALREAAAARQAREARRFDQLSRRVTALEESLVTAKAEAATDALTQLPNRGAFDAALADWVDRAARGEAAFALAMVDLDDFKRINDTHGHPVGDRVIVATARLLQSALGEGEVAARFGGEEFALLLACPTAAKARARLKTLLARLPPAYEYEQDGATRHVRFAFSGGVTAFAPGDTAETLLARADEALYDAKRRGKHRIETSPRTLFGSLTA